MGELGAARAAAGIGAGRAPQPLDTANRGVHGVRGWRGGVGALVATRGTDGAVGAPARFEIPLPAGSAALLMRQHSRVTALASRFPHSTRTASRGSISDTSTSSPQRLYRPPREDARRFSHRMDSRWRLPARRSEGAATRRRPFVGARVIWEFTPRLSRRSLGIQRHYLRAMGDGRFESPFRQRRCGRGAHESFARRR